VIVFVIVRGTWSLLQLESIAYAQQCALRLGAGCQ